MRKEYTASDWLIEASKIDLYKFIDYTNGLNIKLICKHAWITEQTIVNYRKWNCKLINKKVLTKFIASANERTLSIFKIKAIRPITVTDFLK